MTEENRGRIGKPLNEIRLETLLRLHQMHRADERQICDFVLEAQVQITASRLGFLGFIDEDETVMTIHSWSETAMKACRIKEHSMDFRISESGLWGETVRQRRPIIINDYPNHKKWKRGCPKGHVPIIRYMSVPVFSDGRITAVAAVANKQDDYNDDDVNQLQLLTGGCGCTSSRKGLKENSVNTRKNSNRQGNSESPARWRQRWPTS